MASSSSPCTAGARTNPNDCFDNAFKAAMQGFRDKLKNENLYRQILNTTSVEQVYDLTDKLQDEQSRTGQLRHFSKIEPFLAGLRSYAQIIEVFMQAKPDVLALIWGPIKLILHWAAVLKQSMDAIIDTTAEIGALLPEFRKVAHMFGENGLIQEVLILFFRDILEFYAIALKFFGSPRLKLVFEAFWPRQKDKIKIIIGHIQRHTMLLRNEVRLEHIQAEYDFRRQALEHFDKAELSHQRQEYQSIRTNIAPRTYEGKLQYLDDRTCRKAGTWLLKDATFSSWIDANDSSVSNLWLQGIPGSGKTHLAGLAVHEAQKRGHTLYVFLTYAHSSSISALSIINSLIFQLAAHNNSLQSVVCQTSSEKLKSSVEEANKVFRTLLCSAGPVYIIIDGLDEVEPVIRCRIVKILLELSSEIDELSLLISCRPEADISGLLNEAFATIRVNDLNTGGIQAYITQRKCALYDERLFFPEAQNEVDALLAPLATKSQGMFLYAKIVLESISDLEFDEMKKDLSVLPETLNDAYDRILHRINSLCSATAKQKARTIIGWIGVTPTPLTIYELEQALVVHSQGLMDTGTVTSKLPLVRLCGPIVEIVDDYVQFVHFTVQEYFLSSVIDKAIDPQDSRLSLATCCIKYLCQPHHDSDVGSARKSDLILAGAFRFHDFAVTNWLNITKEVRLHNPSNTFPAELVAPLESLMKKRGNRAHESADGQVKSEQWKFLKESNPKVYSLLSNSTRFQDLCLKSSFKRKKHEVWSNLDPLTISHTSCHIHEELDALLLAKDSPEHDTKQLLRRHYGDRPFKCSYVDCAFRRHGFQFGAPRNSHNKNHDKPWKCDFGDCDFAKGGFLSRKMRDDHLERYHSQKQLPIQELIKTDDKDALRQLCFDLVKADDVAGIKDLAAACKLTSDIYYRGGIMECASQYASSNMIRTLLSHAETVGSYIIKNELEAIYGNLFLAAMAGNNFDAFQALLNTTFFKSKRFALWRDTQRRCIKTVFRNGSDEFVDICCAFIEQDSMDWKRRYLPSQDIIMGTEYREDILLSIWKKLPKHVWTRKFWIAALPNVAATTCSFKLAQFLLDQGAPVDGRPSKGCRTALHEAVRKNTVEAAEMAKFLLSHGADPECGQMIRFEMRHIKDEPGAKQISKWLGISWDELLEQTKERNSE